MAWRRLHSRTPSVCRLAQAATNPRHLAVPRQSLIYQGGHSHVLGTAIPSTHLTHANIFSVLVEVWSLFLTAYMKLPQN